MFTAGKKKSFVPFALILFCVVPLAAGVYRLLQLAVPQQVLGSTDRFSDSPFPIVLHILSSFVFCILGAFQFQELKNRFDFKRHRYIGRVVAPSGLIVAATGLWMTLAYPTGSEIPACFDGLAVFVMRIVVAVAMFLSICFGIFDALQRRLSQHRAWMIRAYALGLGASTQVFTHVPFFLVPEMQNELGRAMCMGGGWLVNLLVAEWVIYKSIQK